jgi:hypothetical protein
MWIVYIGTSPHSAWDSADQASKKANVMRNLNRKDVSYKFSEEFRGALSNGHHFDEY